MELKIIILAFRYLI